jgi:hypothetical protein
MTSDDALVALGCQVTIYRTTVLMGEAEIEATKKAISASEIKISNLPGEEDAQKKRLLDEAHERAMHRMAIQKAMKKFTEEAQLILHTGRMRCDLGTYLCDLGPYLCDLGPHCDLGLYLCDLGPSLPRR